MRQLIIVTLILAPFLHSIGQVRDKVKLYKTSTGRIYTEREKNDIPGKNHITKKILRESSDTILYQMTFYDRRLIVSRFQKEGNYCGNPKKLSLAEIKTLYPFNLTKSILLVSFNGDQVPVERGELVNKKRLGYVATADESLKNKLMDLFVNYAWLPKYENIAEADIMFCLLFVNAIVFLDAQDKVIGFLEISFTCHQTRQVPPDMKIGLFCNEKFEILEEIFKQTGVRGLDTP